MVCVEPKPWDVPLFAEHEHLLQTLEEKTGGEDRNSDGD